MRSEINIVQKSEIGGTEDLAHWSAFLVGKDILEEASEAVEDALRGVFDGDGQR